MRCTFFAKTYRNSKLVFLMVICGTLGQLFFTYKGVQTVPFFNYGMYSDIFSSESSHVLYRITLGDSIIPITKLSRFPEDYVLGSIKLYHDLQKTNYNDPIIETIDRRFKGVIPEPIYDHFIHQLSNDLTTKTNFTNWLITIMNNATRLNEKEICVTAVSHTFTGNKIIEGEKAILLTTKPQ